MLRYDVKKMFFDRPAVLERMSRAEVRNLSKFGAFVRRTSRGSLRRGKRVSKPGRPPKIHSREEPGLRTILFAYDQPTHSVVVGPVYLNSALSRRTYVEGTVPGVLERGGRIRLREIKYRGTDRWFTLGRRNPRPWHDTRTRTVRIARRPFMAPALEKEADNFPDLWKNSLGRS